MLDPKILREKPDLIRRMLKDRNVDFDLDSMLSLDLRRRDLMVKTDELRKKKNTVAVEIASKKKTGQDATDAISQMQSVSQELQLLE
ncbi:MAG: serine--tRNA ligase, partial [Candidatus Nitrosotenuis sp.]|nr:serine--tRNA ligase [Candidatus Nitrosotenuis sp.]